MKIFSIFIYIIPIGMLPMTTQAQTFHDAENEQITGHPKSVTYNRSATLETYNFDQEGRIHNKDISDAQYDAQGWMTSCSTIYMGHKTKMTIYYDANHRIASQKLAIGESYILNEYTYADGPCPQEYTMTVCYNGQKRSISTTYSDYMFDAHGNWVSRSATTLSYTSYESRSILYW